MISINNVMLDGQLQRSARRTPRKPIPASTGRRERNAMPQVHARQYHVADDFIGFSATYGREMPSLQYTGAAMALDADRYGLRHGRRLLTASGGSPAPSATGRRNDAADAARGRLMAIKKRTAQGEAAARALMRKRH